MVDRTARRPSAIDRANDRMARRQAVANRCRRVGRGLGRVAATAFVAITGVAVTLTAAEHHLEQHPSAAPAYVIDLCAPHLGGCEPAPESPDPAPSEAAEPTEPAVAGTPAPVVAPPPAAAPVALDDPAAGAGEPPVDGGGLGLMGLPDDAPADPDAPATPESPEPDPPDAATDGCDTPRPDTAATDDRETETGRSCDPAPEPEPAPGPPADVGDPNGEG